MRPLFHGIALICALQATVRAASVLVTQRCDGQMSGYAGVYTEYRCQPDLICAPEAPTPPAPAPNCTPGTQFCQCTGNNKHECSGDLQCQRGQCVPDSYLSASYSEQYCGRAKDGPAFCPDDFVCTIACRNATSVQECWAMDSAYSDAPTTTAPKFPTATPKARCASCGSINCLIIDLWRSNVLQNYIDAQTKRLRCKNLCTEVVNGAAVKLLKTASKGKYKRDGLRCDNQLVAALDPLGVCSTMEHVVSDLVCGTACDLLNRAIPVDAFVAEFADDATSKAASTVLNRVCSGYSSVTSGTSVDSATCSYEDVCNGSGGLVSSSAFGPLDDRTRCTLAALATLAACAV